MEWFILVEIFRKKVIPFEVLTFSCFYQNDHNFQFHLFGLPVPGFISRESKNWYFVHGTTQQIPVFGAEKEYHLTEIFQRNFRTNGKCSVTHNHPIIKTVH